MHRSGAASHIKPLRWLIALFVLLALVEIGLRITTPETQFLDPNTDVYWKAQLRQQLATTPPEKIIPADLSYDANLGWRMKPGYRANGITHNSHGYRGSREYNGPAQKPRVLLLGDSFTYGLGVRDEATFGQQLEKLTKTEVINTGVAAHSIDQSLQLWETEGKHYHPQTVVLSYAVDKFFTNPLTVRNLPKPWYQKNTGADGYQLKGVPVPDLATAQKTGRLDAGNSLRILQAGSWFIAKVKAKLGMETDFGKQAKLSNYLLRQLDHSVKQAGGRLLITFIGHCFDGEPENTLAETRIMASCKENNLHCIDLAEVMRQGDFGSYYGDNCHWSPKGHRLAAETIANWMKHP